MNLTEMKESKYYEVVSYGDLTNEEIIELNQVGFIKGEIISVGTKINCVKNICMFSIENTLYSINKKYIEHVVVEEV